jgi:outer membrane protein
MNKRCLPSLVVIAAIAALPAQAPAANSPALPPRAVIPTPEPSPVVPPVPSVASGYNAPNIRPTSAEIAGVTQQPFVGITLDNAIGMALSRNSDLAIAAGNTRIAGYQIAAARGAYDVTFRVEPSVTHSTTAPLNAFFAGPNFGLIVQNTQSLQAGLSGQLPTGTQYNVSITQQRVDNNTAINAFNPYYYATLNATITQPLLRNAGVGNDVRHQLELSVLSESATEAQTLAAVSSTIAAVENAYWDLLSAWRNVAIQETALHQTILQQQSNVRLAQQQRGAPIDAVESSSQVAVYQSNVFAALQNVSSLQNQLKSLIVNNPGDPIWRANLVPTTPVQQTPDVPSLPDLLATAMKNRPELAQALAQQQQARVDVAYARNQTRPQVDLQLTYTGNGFAGNALPPLGGPFGNATPPPVLGGALGGAYGNIGRLPTYSAGVVISQPLGDHTAKANLQVAQEQARNAAISTANVDQRIQTDVLDAVQNYRTALASLYSARRAREAAEAVYASELRKFHNARSTTFLVTQRQVTLVQDQGLELQAQTNLNKAIVELQRVDGTILSDNNVTLKTLGRSFDEPRP